jgi:acetylornithine deacetylase
MQPAVAERGLMVLDGEARGKAGHAGRREGDNAIYRAMKDIQAIAEISFPEQSRWLPEASAQVTMISAGTGHNTVPDICRFVVDVRSNDRYGNERIMEMLSGACESSLIPRSTRLKSSLLDSDHMFMSAIEACGLTAFGSSTLSDMALISFPSLKMGPGDSARSHTAGEYILISELDRGVKGYCRFLAALAALVKP